MITSTETFLFKDADALCIKGSGSVRRATITEALIEEVFPVIILGCVGNKVVPHCTGFVDREVKYHPSEAEISQPQPNLSIAQQAQRKVRVFLDAYVRKIAIFRGWVRGIKRD